MGRGGEDLGDVVLVAQLGAGHAPTAAALPAEAVGLDGLDVAAVGQGDDELLVVDEVLDVDVAGVEGDLGAPVGGVVGPDLDQLVLDHLAELGVVGQDRLQLGDGLAQLGQLGLQLLAAEPGQARQLHVEDVLGLHVGELEGLGDERLPGGGLVGRGPDGGDDLVDEIEGLDEAFDDVGPVPCLAQSELGAPGDDLDLVPDVGLERLEEVEGAGHAVDQGDHVDRVARLQRRVLVEVVEHDEARGVALEGDLELGLALGGGVVDVGDALDDLVVDQLLDLGRGGRDRGLVRHLGDDDGVALLALDDLGPGPQLHRALAGGVGVDHALAAHEQSAGGEVRCLDELHQVLDLGLGVLEEVDGGVDDLAQVVGRDLRRHADGDALGAVDEQVREPGREDRGLGELPAVGVGEVDGLLVDAVEEAHGQVGQAALGVAGGSGTEVGAAVVAVEVHQRVAQGEGLGHAHEGVVDGAVAVGVEVAHDVAGDAGALHVAAVRAGADVLHAPQDPAVHGLEAVARIGQGPLHDHRHRVLEERVLHLVLELDRLDVEVLFVGGRAVAGRRGALIRHGQAPGGGRWVQPAGRSPCRAPLPVGEPGAQG